jgi:hypothetical protein
VPDDKNTVLFVCQSTIIRLSERSYEPVEAAVLDRWTGIRAKQREKRNKETEIEQMPVQGGNEEKQARSNEEKQVKSNEEEQAKLNGAKRPTSLALDLSQPRPQPMN